MKNQSKTTHTSGIHYPKVMRASKIVTAFENSEELKNFFLPYHLNDLLTILAKPAGKKSFLILKCNKYINVPTENIAFFYIKNELSIIVCFDQHEFFVNYSLNQIQNLLTEQQFFRINRQYLINFNAVKDVEHYFARKLLINLVIPTQEKLLVSKEKANDFLHWLDNR